MIKDLVKELKEVYRFRLVTNAMVMSTLRMRYRRSVLGFGWSILGPLFNYTLIGVIFSYVSKMMVQNSVSYLIMGSCIFGFIAASLHLGSVAMIANESYIKKIYLPKLIFPINSITAEALNFLMTFAAMFIVVIGLGRLHLTWALLGVPVGLILLYLFLVGIAACLSVISVFFRDVMHIVPSFTQLMFFVTPVIYPIDSAPPLLQEITKYNLLYYYIMSIRDPIYAGTFPGFKVYIICGVSSLLFLLAGLLIVKKFDNRIVFKL